MSASRPAVGPPSARTALVAAVALILLIGTVVSFGVGFGVLTDCTDAYRCSRTDCGPCVPAGTWLTGGWVAQGVLLLAASTLAVLSRRGPDPGVVRAAALGLGGLSVVLVVVTTALAVSSY